MRTQQNLSRWWLVVFILVCYGVAAFGAQFTPGDWYQSLQRAPWNPPDFVFPIVWTILYAMIAVAGWRIFFTSDVLIKSLWVVQLALNGAWSWLFFEQHQVIVALCEIVVLVVVVGLLVQRCAHLGQRLAAWLLSPYLTWLLLATSLNAYIAVYN